MKSKVGLLIAAAAAYGAYRYTKMTPEQKSNLKKRGTDFLNKNLGGFNPFGSKKETANGSGY